MPNKLLCPLLPLLALAFAGCARSGDVADAAAGEPAAWHAFGNEPFWSVQAHDGALVFSTPGNQPGTRLSGRRVPSPTGTVILGTGPDGEFRLGITPGACSDGMSDRRHVYASTFRYGDARSTGCAEAVARPGWTCCNGRRWR